tara:strand:+ start:1917 stop:3029 length:1113 start_codon:yes stop_codon:yes gene_type:complete
MSIFSAPSFYGAADRAIYDAGNYFIPQEQYRGAFTMQTPPVTGTSGAAAATGINTVLNQGGGGGGNNPFNPDMNQIRTDFRPDYEFRRFQDYNPELSDLQNQKIMQNMENFKGYDYYNAPPKTGIAGFMDKAINFIPGAGFLSRVGPFIQNMLPVNQRAILENQARGKGILTDDIGRIVAGDGIYNTPEGVMAGYNLNKITDKTFDKRTDRISKTLGDKYGISATDIQGLIDGTLDDDDISAKYGITTNLTSQIRNVQLARQNILGAQAKAKEIADFRETQRIQEKLRKAAEKKSKAAALRAIRQQGRQDYNPNIHGRTDYGRDSSGRQSFDSGQGFGIGSDGGPVSNRTGRGRQGYMMGGLTDLVDIYD